jgi:hypothetical protein
VKRLAFVPLVALFCLALPACEEKTDPAAAPTTAKSSTAAANTAAAQPGAQGDPPTEQDFEEQAEKEITSANIDGELEKLEKEIGQ